MSDRGARRISWPTFWSAVGALAGVAGTIVAIMALRTAPATSPGTSVPAAFGTSATPTASATPTGTPAGTPATSPTGSEQTSVTTVPLPSPGSGSAADQALLDKIPASAYRDCETRHDIDVGLTAANCIAQQAGPSKNPLFILFEEKKEMDAWIDGKAKSVASDGTCPEGKFNSTWRNQNVTRGRLVCAWVDDWFYMYWTFDDAKVGMIAQATNNDVLYRWWMATPLLT